MIINKDYFWNYYMEINDPMEEILRIRMNTNRSYETKIPFLREIKDCNLVSIKEETFMIEYNINMISLGTNKINVSL